MPTLKEWVQKRPFLIHVFIYSVIAISGLLLIRSQERLSDQNNQLACSTADLIAHVPAIQFEGEPLENFIGWIQARQDVLVAAREASTCGPDIIDQLENRIELDDQVLEGIEKDANNN